MIKDENINAVTIAQYFLTKSEATPKKLQKLVYYAYAWFIALNNENADDITSVLFDEQPEAWLHGPVFKSLYSKYKEYSWHEVEKNDNEIIFENDEINSHLNKIFDTYNKYSADDLEYMTHQEDPWKKAREGVSPLESSNNTINKKDIFIYFNKLNSEEE